MQNTVQDIHNSRDLQMLGRVSFSPCSRANPRPSKVHERTCRLQGVSVYFLKNLNLLNSSGGDLDFERLTHLTHPAQRLYPESVWRVPDVASGSDLCVEHPLPSDYCTRNSIMYKMVPSACPKDGKPLFACAPWVACRDGFESEALKVSGKSLGDLCWV